MSSTLKGKFVTETKYDMYGKRMAQASSDGHIHIMDVDPMSNSLQKSTSINAHNGIIWRLSWSDYKLGNYLASCGLDKKVIIWKETAPNKWELEFEHSSHEGSVNCVEWAPHNLGLKLASCSSDGCVSIIELDDDTNKWTTTKFEAHKNPVNSISWAPFTSHRMNQSKQVFCTASWDKKIKIWEFDEVNSNYEAVEEIHAHDDIIRSAVWNPSPLYSYDVIASCSADKKVIFFKSNFNNKNFEMVSKHEFESTVWDVKWNLAGTMLAANYKEKGKKMIAIFKENKENEWVIVDHIKMD